MKWPSWIHVALGAWLVVAPWSLHYAARPPVTNDMILGVLIFIVGLWAATVSADVTAPAWISMVFGVWLILAPWVVGYHNIATRALFNDVLIGLATVFLSVVRVGAAHAVAGGALPVNRAP